MEKGCHFVLSANLQQLNDSNKAKTVKKLQKCLIIPVPEFENKVIISSQSNSIPVDNAFSDLAD